MNHYPKLTINLASIRHNADTLVARCREHHLQVTGVTKSFCAQPQIAQAMLDAGIGILADSRMDNLRQLRQSFPQAKLMLLRITMPSEAEAAVALCDYSVNSELSTIEALDDAAGRMGQSHGVVLMIDMGDLREGLWPEDAVATAQAVEKLNHVHLAGIAVNFACFGGVLPDEDNTTRFAQVALEIDKALGRKLEMVSIGGTTCLDLLGPIRLHPRISHLRIGEGISVGTNASQNGASVAGTRQDGFCLEAQIIELKEKPSVPIGTIGCDAFGNVPAFPDKGKMLRAVLAIGKQDSSFDLLIPRDSRIEVLGGSSDHMICDFTRCGQDYRVGDIVEFGVGWSAMLHLMTSPYVNRQVRD